MSYTSDDLDVVSAINRSTDAGLTVLGRSAAGELGGAVFVEWPDGRAGVVTVFHSGLAEAHYVASVLNSLQTLGLPVPRHELVVDLGDRVVFVQQRLPSGPSRQLSPGRVDEMVKVNELFAGVLAGHSGVPSVLDWFEPAGDNWNRLLGCIPGDDGRAREVVREMDRLISNAEDDVLAGCDLVHVDLTAANVLFDEGGHATAVVDWNLGVYRGDHRLALVQTRFDREWFVRRADADETVLAAAYRLDEILVDRIASATLRVFWAYWLRHHLPKALRIGNSEVIGWHLALAESRLQ